MSEEKGESNEVVGRDPRARRFSGNERNQANGTTRAVPERAAFLFGLFGEQSLQYPLSPQVCDGCCRERFPTVPYGEATSPYPLQRGTRAMRL